MVTGTMCTFSHQIHSPTHTTKGMRSVLDVNYDKTSAYWLRFGFGVDDCSTKIVRLLHPNPLPVL